MVLFCWFKFASSRCDFDRLIFECVQRVHRQYLEIHVPRQPHKAPLLAVHRLVMLAICLNYIVQVLFVLRGHHLEGYINDFTEVKLS